jgi:hypothetical protein
MKVGDVVKIIDDLHELNRYQIEKIESEDVKIVLISAAETEYFVKITDIVKCNLTRTQAIQIWKKENGYSGF